MCTKEIPLYSLPDQGIEDPSLQAVDSEEDAFKAKVEEAISSHLTNRQRQVVLLVSGYEDGPEMSYEEVANLLGITRGRVYKLMVRARRRLSHPSAGLISLPQAELGERKRVRGVYIAKNSY